MNSLRKGIVGVIAIVATCFTGINGAQAQVFNMQGDLVNSYVWRGVYQGGGACLQPTLGVGMGNFSLTAWGSTNLSGGNKELDLTLAYKCGKNGPTFTVADLWWIGEGRYNYFNYNSHETNHHFEAGVSYTLPVAQFPLSVAWYTMFAGEDKSVNDGGQNYSSYIELSYPFNVKSYDLNLTCGLLPYQAASGLYGDMVNGGFAVTNVALKAMKEIKISDSFSLPIFAQVIWNPCLEDAHLVVGITLRP